MEISAVNKPSDIEVVVFDCIDQLNRQLPAEGKLSKADDSVLAGESGMLDSLGLITLCVNIEQGLSDKLGTQCAVLDELMIEHPEHPFRTVGTMVQWIAQHAQATV
jgi:D-alanine--poly(phosphoribitol) ligase subunit 2